MPQRRLQALRAPFTESSAVRAVARTFGKFVAGPRMHELTVQCDVSVVGELAWLLRDTGVAGLRVVVRTNGSVPVRAVRDLALAGVARLQIDGHRELAEAELPEWFEMSKATVAFGLPLRWNGTMPPPARPHARHLPPPGNDEMWCRDWKFGMLGWRRGPGFVEVLDCRDGLQQLTIVSDTLTPLFGRELNRPSGLEGADAALREAGLVAVFAGRAVWLPYRLRAWPVNPL
ncbi:DUF5825 family protein [Allorhizocola rhizosphaerae]|uniref:DUF5825 family protein n=1 Tax=Allorhizocola rhizosphaerae TaxID=1872709 RepID=UPI000E3D3D6C|nr:DUF5825 family protein [Allorhizocola rhizosphaerae]